MASEAAGGYGKRPFWLKVPFISLDQSQAKPPGAKQELTPEATAGWFSRLTFGWLTHILVLGYARPLEVSDLYELPADRFSALIADRIVSSFGARCARAEEYNRRLANRDISPGFRNLWWILQGNRAEREKRWRNDTGRHRASLIMAMHDSVKSWFWLGAVFKIISDTGQMTSPLVIKALINFATESFEAHQGHRETAPSLGRGLGLAFALFALQTFSSICQHHFFYRSSATGVLLRSGLITAIYSRSMRMTSRARAVFPDGKLISHISTDVSRIEYSSQVLLMGAGALVQIVICFIILLLNLGPSALTALALLVVITPLQLYAMKRSFALRKKSTFWTDKRAQLLHELLGGMKIIKFFAWEDPFLGRMEQFRASELGHIRSLLLLRSANNAVATSFPVIAAVLSFVTFALSGNTLRPAEIFTALALFQLSRIPLMALPVASSSISDAKNALNRIYGIFEAELLADTRHVKLDLNAAIEVKGADFAWEDLSTHGTSGIDQDDNEAGFQLHGIDITIPRGQLVAIVGRVGSGKSSLLQGLIGEMRRTSGTVDFGASVSYCPQVAWIQNATIRDNITFGRPFVESRYWDAVRDSCLGPDLVMLPEGDLTEVGEKGITLSGGQKQRINICRALYYDADIQIFDDPLSALDAHVGNAVFNNAILRAPSKKTRILVTNALYVLSKVDCIFTIVDGKVTERGTYGELLASKGDFSRFMDGFGLKASHEAANEIGSHFKDANESQVGKTGEQERSATRKGIIRAEERNVGAVSASVYKAYIGAGNGRFLMPSLFAAVICLQVATVFSSYWLVWWQDKTFNHSQTFYVGIYTALGAGQAITYALMGLMFSFLTYFASKNLHRAALRRVTRAPMAFFETTPLGRIMNRFCKDMDTVDNNLNDSLRMFTYSASSIVGAIILIGFLLHWFLVVVAAVSYAYYLYAIFYRSSARELKRLDAGLRSSLYSHFSESLAGIPTIRAYGEMSRFIEENQRHMDAENRAYWLTVTNQRWLGVRLDFLGNLLTFFVAIFAVAARFSISPAQTGLTLSYMVAVQSSFGWMIRQSAEVENDMNSSERVVHYAKEIPQEESMDPPRRRSAPPTWPMQGQIDMSEIVMRYRPDLPPIIKSVSMSINGGEKIGIVGRTGAGKSSIMSALYRLVEPTSGSIKIDGIDISHMAIGELRRNIAIIPQDAILFSGTLRTNLDPFGTKDDASLWKALRQSYLAQDTPSFVGAAAGESSNHEHMPTKRFNLDSRVEREGANLSLGERSLVSLARALVKDSKILILDEATASVDHRTDSSIQETIASVYKERTVLCIAHRLQTVLAYDRVCVLDQGQLVECDRPALLHAMPDGVFRGMCDKASISLEDILNASAKRS